MRQRTQRDGHSEHVDLGPLRGWGRTERGRVRKENQDAWSMGPLGDPPWAMAVVVADGMGGTQGGREAAVQVVEGLTEGLKSLGEADLASPSGRASLAGALERLIQSAHEGLQERAAQDSALRGMGSTLIAGILTKECLLLAHVGDSRCYRIRDGVLSQLTMDHSVAGQFHALGRSVPAGIPQSQRTALLRAMGPGAEAKPTLLWASVEPGDVYLFCTDGLTRCLGEPELAEAVATEQAGALLVDELVAAALGRGGDDNITAVLTEVEGNRLWDAHGGSSEEFERNPGDPFRLPIPPPSWSSARTEPRLPRRNGMAGSLGLWFRGAAAASVILLGAVAVRASLDAGDQRTEPVKGPEAMAPAHESDLEEEKRSPVNDELEDDPRVPTEPLPERAEAPEDVLSLALAGRDEKHIPVDGQRSLIIDLAQEDLKGSVGEVRFSAFPDSRVALVPDVVPIETQQRSTLHRAVTWLRGLVGSTDRSMSYTPSVQVRGRAPGPVTVRATFRLDGEQVSQGQLLLEVVPDRGQSETPEETSSEARNALDSPSSEL